MDSFSKCVFVRAGKYTSVQDVHPHSNVIVIGELLYDKEYCQMYSCAYVFMTSTMIIVPCKIIN